MHTTFLLIEQNLTGLQKWPKSLYENSTYNSELKKNYHSQKLCRNKAMYYSMNIIQRTLFSRSLKKFQENLVVITKIKYG